MSVLDQELCRVTLSCLALRQAFQRESESGVRTWGGGLGTLAPRGPAWGSCLTVPQSHLVRLAGTPCCKPQEGRVFLGKGVGS